MARTFGTRYVCMKHSYTMSCTSCFIVLFNVRPIVGCAPGHALRQCCFCLSAPAGIQALKADVRVRGQINMSKPTNGFLTGPPVESVCSSLQGFLLPNAASFTERPASSPVMSVYICVQDTTEVWVKMKGGLNLEIRRENAIAVSTRLVCASAGPPCQSSSNCPASATIIMLNSKHPSW